MITCGYASGALRPSCKIGPWLDADLPGEDEPCCCISKIRITRKDKRPKGWPLVPVRTFRFRAQIEKNSCIRNVEFVWYTCWRKEIPTPPGTPDWIAGAICPSWMQTSYDLKIWWSPFGTSRMLTDFIIKWQECVPTPGAGNGKWKTQRKQLGKTYN